MLKNKKRWSAMALAAVMLLSGINPATVHAEESTTVISAHEHGTLTVTPELVDAQGVLTLENVNWDKIVIPASLGAVKINLKNVTVAELVVESGTDCAVEISGGAIETLEVAASGDKIPNLQELAELLHSGMTKEEAKKAYQKNKEEAATKNAKLPTITLKDAAVVNKIEAAGNASLSLKEGRVAALVVTATVAGNNQTLVVDGFEGTLSVRQSAKTGSGYGVVQVELNNSKLTKAEFYGDSKGSLVVNGTNSVITEAVVDGSAKMVLDVETRKLETAKKSEGVSLIVLSQVEEAVLNGNASDLTLGTAAVIKKAVINGDNASVEGKGKLESAEVGNASAEVKTEGTSVYDPATVTATPDPTKAPDSEDSSSSGSSGSSSGSSGGSSSGGSYVPRPTYAPPYIPSPTYQPQPTITPGGSEEVPDVPDEDEPEEEVHVHQWNVEEATCVTAKVCQTCGYKEEDATGQHIYEEEGQVTAPTCTEAGYTTYKCKNCDETKIGDIEPCLGHEPGEWSLGEAVKDEQCTYTQVATCKRCKKTVTSETTVKKHSAVMTVEITKEATCQETGEQTYYCSECDSEIMTKPYENKDAHKWDDGSEQNGKTVYHCTVEGCDATKSVVTMTDAGISSAELDDNTEVEVAGTGSGVLMSLDDKVLTQIKGNASEAASAPALKLSADVLDESEKQEAVKNLPEAEKEQIGDNAIYNLDMTVDGEKVSKFNGSITVRIPYTLQEGEDPESVAVWYLNDAGEVEMIQGKYHDGVVSFTTNHFSYYTVVRLAPEARCKLFGHLYLSVETKPTCTEDGYITKICQRCGDTQTTKGKEATGHKMEVKVLEEATCQHKGKEQHWCKSCDFSFEVEVPKGKHNPKEKENGRHEATCLKDGYIEYECECGYHKNETIKATGHIKGEDGRCTVCGAKVNCKHKTVILVKLAEGAESCLDGVICTRYCLLCETELEEWTTTEHIQYVANLINLYPYGENCPGYVYEWGCACGETGSEFYRSNELFEGYGDWVGKKQPNADGTGTIITWTSASEGVRVEFESVELTRDGCDITEQRTFRVYVNDELKHELGGTMAAKSHTGWGYKATLLEGSQTCTDGVQVTDYCLSCGESTGSWTEYEHFTVRQEEVDLSTYENTCGGSFIKYGCACGEETEAFLADKNCNFKMTSSSYTDKDGMGHGVQKYTCQNCSFSYEYDFVDAYGDDCQAIRSFVVKLYVGNTLIKTFEYDQLWTYHQNKIVTKAELLDASKGCKGGVRCTEKCQDCGEEITNTYYYHKPVKSTRLEMSKFGASCGGYISFDVCACGESSSVTDKMNCETGWNLWSIQQGNGNYKTITSEDDYTLERMTLTCAVTEPKCDLELIVERRITYTSSCYGTVQIVLCYDEDGDGTYEEEYVLNEYSTSRHQKMGDAVVTYETAEDGTALKVMTSTCKDCGKYSVVSTYADYLEDESYAYMLERIFSDSAMNSEYKHVLNYDFSDPSHCSVTRRFINGSYVKEYALQPGCVADEYTTDRTCTQYGKGVCLMCGNENALYGSDYSWRGQDPWGHNFQKTENGYTCQWCGLESVSGQNGNIILEDMSDTDNYIAGYWNKGELVFEVYVMLVTEDGTKLTDLTVDLEKIFLTGTATISKADVAEWAAENDITGSYEVMFSFIPKDADANNTYNIGFTE